MTIGGVEIRLRDPALRTGPQRRVLSGIAYIFADDLGGGLAHRHQLRLERIHTVVPSLRGEFLVLHAFGMDPLPDDLVVLGDVSPGDVLTQLNIRHGDRSLDPPTARIEDPVLTVL